MERVLIAGSARTPIGIYDGKLKDLKEEKLAVIAVQDALSKAHLAGEHVDEIVIGIAKQTSSPSNAARYIGLAAGLPETVPAYTVQCQGASGLQAVVNGFTKIRAGSADVILAGGAESMSQIPYEIQDARYDFRPDKIVMDPIPAMVAGGQPKERYGRLTIQDMNRAIAAAHGISLEAQEAYAAASLAKARASTLEEELVPVEVRVKKNRESVTADELYCKPEVTAGAADAAAMCVLIGETAAQRLQTSVIAELVSVGLSAGSPAGEGMVGAAAVQKALTKAGKTADEIDLIAVNEATAAQALSVIAALGLSAGEAEKKVNPYGGALASGNPWGAAGCVELHKLLCGLKAQNKQWGLVVCGGEGGQALAAVVKMR